MRVLGYLLILLQSMDYVLRTQNFMDTSSAHGNIKVMFLAGPLSQGEFYSVALTTNYQQADTGTKMIHLISNTKSNSIKIFG